MMSKSSITTEPQEDGEDALVLAPPGGFPVPAAHPGTILAEEISARGLSANRLALDLRVPANRIHDIVRGRRGLSAETALRLARYFGTSAQFWMNLQAYYDLEIARKNHGEKIAREVEAA